MMPVPDACATLRFSTEGMPEERRAQAVRELHLHERTILFARLEPIEPLDPLPSFADRNISSVAFDVGSVIFPISIARFAGVMPLHRPISRNRQ